MKQTPIKLGPLALLLAVISICLTTLSILTFTTARADLSLAQKYAQTVRTRYELEARGQTFLGEAAAGDPAALADTETDEDGIIWHTIEQDGARLRIGLVPDGESGYTVAAWRLDREWTQDTSIGKLWNGF